MENNDPRYWKESARVARTTYAAIFCFLKRNYRPGNSRREEEDAPGILSIEGIKCTHIADFAYEMAG